MYYQHLLMITQNWKLYDFCFFYKIILNMLTKGFTLLILLLVTVISADKTNDDITEILKVDSQKNTYNISTDLLFMNRNNATPLKQKDNILRVLVIGDFGSMIHFRDLSKNTEMMNKLATQYEYDHIITVGDNTLTYIKLQSLIIKSLH